MFNSEGRGRKIAARHASGDKVTARTRRVVERLAGAVLAAGLAASLSLAIQGPLPAAAATTTWLDRPNGWRGLTPLPPPPLNTPPGARPSRARRSTGKD